MVKPGNARRTGIRTAYRRNRRGFPMKQIRISKQHRAARKWLEPLPLELRDPDVVRAKQLVRRADSRSQRQRRSG